MTINKRPFYYQEDWDSPDKDVLSSVAQWSDKRMWDWICMPDTDDRTVTLRANADTKDQ